MKAYLGLDLSFSGTGFFLLREDGSSRHMEIKTAPKDFTCLVKRTRFIADRVLDGIGGERIELVLLEDCYIGGRSYAGTGIMLAALGTIVRDRLLCGGYSYINATPAQIKKFETGSGSAGKELMLKSVFKNHDVDVSSNNVADACAMAYFCRAYCRWLNGGRDFHKYQIEVFRNMKTRIEDPYQTREKAK